MTPAVHEGPATATLPRAAVSLLVVPPIITPAPNTGGRTAPDDQWGSALCSARDPGLWFADTPEGQSRAALICHTSCPLREKCLQRALERRERHGVWGGTTPAARKLLVDRLTAVEAHAWNRTEPQKPGETEGGWRSRRRITARRAVETELDRIMTERSSIPAHPKRPNSRVT